TAGGSVTTATVAVGGREARKLVDSLAGDLRVVRQAKADAAALTVDFDHSHCQLVALVEDLLDCRDPATRGDVGDMQQAVRALGELDESAERGRLDDLAGELVADFDLLGHRPDA